MNIDGNWWLMMEGAHLDRELTPRLTLQDGTVTWSDGTQGAYLTHEGKLWLKRSSGSGATERHERYQILRQLDDGDYCSGRCYVVLGDLEAFNASGRPADFTSFTMVRDGSVSMAAIQVAQARKPDLEPSRPADLPITDLDAPGALLRGNWVMLVEDEPLDPGHNRVLDLDDVKLQRVGDTLLVNVSETERIALYRVSDDSLSVSGLLYRGTARLPDGDPGKLWDALEDVDPEDERHDLLPNCDPVSLIQQAYADTLPATELGRFEVIDVSMYSHERVSVSGFHAATTDDEREAALRSLPSAKVILRESQAA